MTVESDFLLSDDFLQMHKLRREQSSRILRATASKYGESHDSSENSDFFLLRQKDPFGELFSEIYFQSSSEFTFL